MSLISKLPLNKTAASRRESWGWYKGEGHYLAIFQPRRLLTIYIHKRQQTNAKK